MRIEFLTKPDCAPSELMHERLKEALGAESFTVVDLTKIDPANPRRGYDTPTVLVDGSDLFAAIPRDDLSVPPT
jgi:hypothetical protein